MRLRALQPVPLPPVLSLPSLPSLPVCHDIDDHFPLLFPILCPTVFTKSYMMLSIFCTQVPSLYSGRVSRRAWLLKLLASLELRRHLFGEIVPQSWRRRAASDGLRPNICSDLVQETCDSVGERTGHLKGTEQLTSPSSDGYGGRMPRQHKYQKSG